PGGKETLLHEEPLRTDTHGRAILKWTAASAGYFRIAFRTRDTAGEAVSGETWGWGPGPGLAKGRLLFPGVTPPVEDLYYEEGNPARVLLVTPAPDCTVLLTREANDELLERRVVHVPGHSIELRIPLSRQDIPNVYLTATMVRGGQLYETTEELFVPPT